MSTFPPVPHGARTRKGMHPLAIVAIVIAAGIGFVAVIGIIAAIAIPALLRSRASANEASAIGSLRSIAAAQAVYSSDCGAGSYAPTLEVLGQPNPTRPGSTPYVNLDLARPDPVEKSGYTFHLTGTPDPNTGPSCNGVRAGEGLRVWAVVATPTQPGMTGTRFLAIDTSGTVFESQSPITLSPEQTPLPPAQAVR